MTDHRLEIVLAGKDATQKAFKSATARIKGFTKSVFNMRNAMVGAAGMAGMGYLIDRSIDVADSIAKTADSVGVSTDALQKYRYIAERSGVQTNKLDQSFKKFASRLSDLETGSGPLINRLEGVNDETLEMIKNSNSTSEALDIVFQQMQKYEGQTDQMRIATAAFGREQAATITNMAKNARELEQRYEELGLQIDGKLLRGAEDARDAIDDLGAVISRSFTKAMLELAPEIESAASSMAGWVAENQKFITSDIPDVMESFADGVSSAASFMADLAENAKKAYVFSTALTRPDRAGAMAWNMMFGGDDEVINKRTVDLSGLNDELQGKRGEGNALDPITVTADRIIPTKRVDYDKPARQALDMDDLADAQRIIEDTRTPLENLYSDLERLNELWTKGAFGDDRETYYRAIEAYGTRFSDTFDKIEEKGESTFDALGNAFDGWANNFSRMLNDMVWEADASFSDIAESAGRMVTQVLIQKSIIEPAANALGGIDWGELFGGPKASGGSVYPGTTYVVGERGPELLTMGADRGHVTPNHQISGTGGTSVEVNVYNNSGASVDVQESQGGKSIDVIIDQAVAGKVNQRGSATNRALRAGHRTRQQLIRR